MSFVKPIDYKTLDISRVSVSKPKDVSKDGVSFGKRVYLQYNHPTEGLVPLVIKTPKMKYNFGLSAWDSDNGPKKYVLNSYFTGESTKGFLEFCVALEEQLKEFIVDNSTSWFNVKKAFTRDIVDQMETLYPLVKRKYNKETGEEYPPSLKFNFPVWPSKTTGKPEFTTSVFLSKNEKLTIDPNNTDAAIPPQSEGEAVIACSLFISTQNRKVSLSLNTNMVKVYPKKTQTLEFPFSDDEDEPVVRADPSVFSDSGSDETDAPGPSVPVVPVTQKNKTAPVVRKPLARRNAIAPVVTEADLSEAEED